MSFAPSRMSRVLIGGHQRHLAHVVDVLHKEGVVHLEDFHDDAGLTTIGTPLPAGAAASENLVAVRGLAKALGTEDAPAATVDNSPERTLADARSSLDEPIARLTAARAELASLATEASALAPLAGLEVELGLVGSLKSVKVLVGTCRTDPRSVVANASAHAEIQVTPSLAVAVVAPIKDATAVEKALAECGFASANITAGKSGTPSQRLAALEKDTRAAEGRLADAEKELVRLQELWGMRLASAEKALAGAVERTQAPLQFGVTQETFHVEGWVPQKRVAELEKLLQSRFGESLYVHDLGDAAAPEHVGEKHTHASGHDHGEHSGGADGHGGSHDDDHHDDPAAEPPIHLENGKAARGYQWILGLLGMPRYKELNPSRLLWFFFPIFFALMVGDVVTGILIAIFGHWLKTNKVIGIGGPAVGKALMAGGILTILVGAFVFGEAMGIHFVVNPEQAHEGDMSWEQILNLHIPFSDQAHGLLFKTGTADSVLLENRSMADIHPASPTHLSLGGFVNLGYYSKLHDVQPLMIWALCIALVHIILGLLIGYRNVKAAHGGALALQEKGAWLILMAGAAIAIVGGGMLVWVGVGVCVAAVALLWMGAAKVYGAGYIAVLEMPGLVGNIVSYTRLAAIGAAEAGLGLAVTTIAFKTIAGGNIHSLVAWAIYTVVFLGLTLLSILSGSLQSLRLQFVEFFGKFFVGGGRPYVPFGRRAN